MGGSGSGCHYHWWRSSKKTTVEDCRHLEANRLMREGILKAGVWHHGGWAWFRDEERKEKTSSIGYEVNTQDAAPRMRLSYTLTKKGEPVDYSIALATTQPRLGGVRWWFICPLVANGRPCNRRVGKLYLPPGGRYFGCRHCYDLAYTSSQESHKFDGLYRHMAQNMGCDVGTVRDAMKQIGRR
jgi:hypothetical protein